MLELIRQSIESPITLLYVMVLGAALAGSAVELVVSTLGQKRLFSLDDSAANLTLYAGYVLIGLVWVHVVFIIYTTVADHALVSFTVGGWHLGNNGLWWEWLLLFVLEDLCFYTFHRASHRVRFLWASHVTHHSSRHFNLTVAFRQTWVPFTAVIFWIPLLLIGFDPLMVMTVQFVSLSYQELLHTQLVPSLGPIGWIFNTPAHHAAHHGRNAPYVDKNFGGVLIIWDRLFGSFARREGPIEFGIDNSFASHNPITIAFHEWWSMAKGLASARSFRAALAEIVGRP